MKGRQLNMRKVIKKRSSAKKVPSKQIITSLGEPIPVNVDGDHTDAAGAAVLDMGWVRLHDDTIPMLPARVPNIKEGFADPDPECENVWYLFDTPSPRRKGLEPNMKMKLLAHYIKGESRAFLAVAILRHETGYAMPGICRLVPYTI